MMFNNRRRFIQTAGLVVGATALTGLRLPAAETSVSLAEREVSAIIAQYGSSVRTDRHSDQTMEIIVKVRSAKHFSKVFDPNRLPFKQIYVGSRNTLKFTHRNTEFTLKHVA